MLGEKRERREPGRGAGRIVDRLGEMGAERVRRGRRGRLRDAPEIDGRERDQRGGADRGEIGQAEERDEGEQHEAAQDERGRNSIVAPPAGPG